MNRRQFLGLAAAAPFALRTGRRFRAALTTDLKPWIGDPDDLYDVASSVALGFHGVVLDTPMPNARRAVTEAGARLLEPKALRDVDAVVVVGAGTNAARHYRGQRVVLFAGDAQGVPEANELMDPDAYAYLRRKNAIWVPCFDGGVFTGSERASWTLTSDDSLLGGSPWRDWFSRYCTLQPQRSIYAGAYLAFAFRNNVAGSTARPFRHRADLAALTRQLLAEPRKDTLNQKAKKTK